MKISKKYYNDIIIALDGIRCDNREDRQDIDTQKPLREISQDVMQYIERKGYCKYIYGANCRFVRVLTNKGYEILGTGSYSKYIWKQSLKSWAIWLPIFISALAVYIAYKDKRKDADTINVLKYRIEQLETSPKQTVAPVNPLPTEQTKPQNSNTNSLDTAKPN